MKRPDEKLSDAAYREAQQAFEQSAGIEHRGLVAAVYIRLLRERIEVPFARGALQ